LRPVRRLQDTQGVRAVVAHTMLGSCSSTMYRRLWCHLFNESHNRRMVKISTAFIHQCYQHLLYQAS
jgi:hypothetical protein